MLSKSHFDNLPDEFKVINITDQIQYWTGITFDGNDLIVDNGVEINSFHQQNKERFLNGCIKPGADSGIIEQCDAADQNYFVCAFIPRITPKIQRSFIFNKQSFDENLEK